MDNEQSSERPISVSGDATRFWRAVEKGDLQGAEELSKAGFFAQYDLFDSGTKQAVDDALAGLRSRNERNRAKTSGEDTRPPITTIPRAQQQVELSFEERKRTINSILDFFQKGEDRKGYAIFERLPTRIDKAKALCVLLSRKQSGGRTIGGKSRNKVFIQIPKELGGIGSLLSLSITREKREELVAELFLRYF